MKDLTLVMKYSGKPLVFARLSVAVWDILKEDGGEVLLLEEGDLTNPQQVIDAQIAEEQALNESGEMFTAHGPFTSEEEAAFNAASSNNAPTKPKLPLQDPKPEKPTVTKIGCKCPECGFISYPQPGNYTVGEMMDIAGACMGCGRVGKQEVIEVTK